MPKASTVRPSQTTQNTKTPTHQQPTPQQCRPSAHEHNDFKQKSQKRRYSRPLYSSQTTQHPKQHNHHHRQPHHFKALTQRTNRLSQTPNSHDKPKTPLLTQPHKQCQPQHTHTLKQTMRHNPTTNNHTNYVAEPVTYSPRNKNKQKYSLERR
jgi:hypothetical protein